MVPTHRAGWMGNILAKLMELSREGFALTGAAKFADGAFMSVSVTVVHSTCTIWEEHLVVPSVTVETRGIVSSNFWTLLASVLDVPMFLSKEILVKGNCLFSHSMHLLENKKKDKNNNKNSSKRAPM